MQKLLIGTIASALLGSTAIVSAYAADVTTDRLLKSASEPQNWLQVNGDYSSHRFSSLNDINKDNVKNLHVVFTTAIGGLPGGGTNATGGLQASPLVADGSMYLPDGWGAVYKIDLTNPALGRIAWIMDPGVNKSDVWIPSNRGVTLYKNFVVSVTGDAKVLWTKADTGELVKSVQVGDTKVGDSVTAAPLLINDELIVPGTGGDRGARAHIDAINADTGAPIWRMYTVPAPGEPGSETWKGTNNAWEHGGGSYWQTGSYDPDQNITVWGSGQPVPMFDAEYRPGDNLFTNSSIAYDVKTGARKWYFQYTPGDFSDYDEIGSQILVDQKIDGQPRKTLIHFGRNGFFYTLDRVNGSFIAGAQYVNKLDWTAGLDPKTGKPVEYDPSKDLQTYKLGSPQGRRSQTNGIDACPNYQGGVNYFPTTYSSTSGLAYGAGIEGCQTITVDASRSGGKVAWNGGSTVNNERQLGSITAMDPATGKRVAQYMFPYTSYSGTISTAGGLVFTTTIDGAIYAMDDKTLQPLWTFNTGTFSSAPPIVFGNGGKEYVAVLLGASGTAKSLLNHSPETSNLQDTSMLYVFGL